MTIESQFNELLDEIRDLKNEIEAQEARAVKAESEVERLKGEVKRLTEWQAVLKALHDAINAADLDVSSCRKCGCLVVCLPDGMPMCRKCAEKREGGA